MSVSPLGKNIKDTHHFRRGISSQSKRVLIGSRGGGEVTQAFLPVVRVDALDAAGTDKNVSLTFCEPSLSQKSAP